MHQRTEDLPDREVERIGVEHRPDVLRPEPEPCVGGLEQPEDIAVWQQRALGLAGGTRGVDHIGEVVGVGQRRQVVLWVTLQPVAFLVQAQAVHAVGNRQPAEQVALRQQQANAAVLDHVRQAVLGIVRVQRYVGTAGLEDRQQADQHLQAPVHRQPHQPIRADPAGAQMVRQLIGPAVQLAIGQAAGAMGHRQRIRRLQGLGLDQLVGTGCGGVRRGRRVPGPEGVLPLHPVQHRQGGDTLLRVRANGFQQAPPMPGQALDGGLLEQVTGVGERRSQARVAFEGVKGQVKLRGALFPRQPLDTQAGQLAHLATNLGLVVVHHLEQRRAVQAAFRLQGFHQLLEGQVLVGLGVERRSLHLLQQLGKGHLGIDLGPQNLGVDEETDQPFRFHTATVGDGHPDADIGLAAIAVQQGLEGGQQQHEQGDPLLPGNCLQGLGQWRRQVDGQALSGQALVGRTRSIDGQFQHRLLAPQLALPVAELAFLFARLHPVTLPLGVVGILDRQGRQFDLAALAETIVQTDQFIDHDRHRPAIADDVVQGEDQDMIVFADLQQPHPQQGPVLQVEGPLHLSRHAGADLFIEVFGNGGRQALRRQREHIGRMDHLQDLPGVLAQGRAQGFVAPDQRLETAPQRFGIQAALQAQGRGDVVGGAARLQLPEDPLALLGIGQRRRRL